MTLLASVNNVLLDLREDTVDMLTSEERIGAIVAALNRKARDHLRSREWQFLERYDGFAFFPGIFTADTGGLTVQGSTFVLLNSAAANAWATSDATRFTTRVRAKIRFTNSAEFYDTSFLLSDLATTAHFPGTLSTAYQGVAINSTGAIEVYAHEYVLPDTVRQITSTFDQQGPIELRFVDRSMDYDALVIRPTQRTAERPEACYVGGVFSTTTLDSAAATSGKGLTIWPPCTRDVYVQYHYIYQHADLSADTDAWSQVPDEHVSYIESRAFEHLLRSNVQANPARADELGRENGRWLARLEKADDSQPRRRMVMLPFGYRTGDLDYRGRWATQTVVP